MKHVIFLLAFVFANSAHAVNAKEAQQMLRNGGIPIAFPQQPAKAQQEESGCRFAHDCRIGEVCVINPLKRRGVCVSEDARAN